MKPNSHFFFWLLLVFSTAFVACRKTPTDPPPKPGKEEKLVRVQVDRTIIDYRYNTDGKLVEIRDSMAGTMYTSKHALEYSGGRLRKMRYGLMTYAYEYPDNQTVVVNAGSESNPVLTREVFKYAANRLVEYVRYDAVTNVPEIKTDFTYDAAGNISRQEDWVYGGTQTTQWKKIASASTTYEDKPNLSAGLEIWQLPFPFVEQNLPLLKNNPIKTEWFDGNGRLLRTHLFQYEYDGRGRKTKRIEERVVNNRSANRETSWFTYQ